MGIWVNVGITSVWVYARRDDWMLAGATRDGNGGITGKRVFLMLFERS